MSRILQATIATMMVFPMTAMAGDLRVEGQFISTVPTGTPPLEVSSTTGVANLNADTVDGFHGSEFYTVTELASSGAAEVHFDNITNIPAGGVKEIDQECATVGGCFSGDNGGYPVTISESGSYRLTGNLDLTAEDANRDAIDVQAANVTIDLNGFVIFGATICTGDPVSSCSPTGSGDGIQTTSVSYENLTVRNGTIRGMGQNGVNCSTRCTVDNLRAVENGLNGIGVSNRMGIVRDSLAHRNGSSGISGGAVIRNNSVEHNGGYGIFSQPASTVIGNVVSTNGGNGIRCFSCVVLDNTVLSNDGFGLELGAGAAYGRNMIHSNNSGAITGSGLQVDTNLCGAGSACP